jgi:D-lyxose ketol-isomerase
MTDNRANLTATLTIGLSPANTFNDGGDVATASGAATVLLAADATRKTAVICNPSTNVATVRVGTSTVNAAKGIPLEPGESISLDCTCALYGFQASGGAVTVSAASIQLI